jgi:hypothetical protein
MMSMPGVYFWRAAKAKNVSRRFDVAEVDVTRHARRAFRDIPKAVVGAWASKADTAASDLSRREEFDNRIIAVRLIRQRMIGEGSLLIRDREFAALKEIARHLLGVASIGS